MIIRRRHTANFTTIGNKLFEDDRLAADELGILAFLRSKPHDWEVRRPALMKRFRIGRDALKRIVTNWMRYGWCGAQKTKRPDGTFCIVYEIRDEPGPELSEDEIRRALSSESGEAVSDEVVRNSEPCVDASLEDELCVHPPTCQPALDEPALADPPLAYIDIQNTEVTKDDSTKRLEREGEREKMKHAVKLAEFKRRWPTTAADNQAQVDKAWFALAVGEGEAALAGIAPFLEHLKRLNKKHPPAGWRYLEEKRWTLLETAAAAPRSSTSHARDSVEAGAIRVLFKLAGASHFFHSVIARGESISYAKIVTPRLAALAQAGPEAGWPELNRQQAAAWEAVLREFVTVQVRKHLVAGDHAPWLWPPSAEGKLYLTTGPPDELMTEQDKADFK